MHRAAAVWAATMTLALGSWCWAGAEGEPAGSHSLMDRETLTDGWFGADRIIAEIGLTINYTVTQFYQQEVYGGLSPRGGPTDWPGSGDLELELDLDQAIGLTGGRVYLLGESSWSPGINDRAVGAFFNVNDDAGGTRLFDVTQLWYEQALLEGRIRIRIGKIDLTGGFECHNCPVSFDGNTFANDATLQFFNSALVKNPTIPFPDSGLGAAIHVEPVHWLYLAAGVADAQADKHQMGFNTAFDGHGSAFTIVEGGVTPAIPSRHGPLQGAYRVGLWCDPQSKPRLDGRGDKTDGVGVYVSLDQWAWREPGPEDDRAQGLGLFARFGVADETVHEVTQFYSAGAQYRGLIPTRDADVLAFGLASGLLSDEGPFTASHETVLETYYLVQITPWVSVSGDLQVVLHPGGSADLNNALVVGLRLNVAF